MSRVYLSIGSNIDKQINIRNGVQALRQSFTDFILSPVYESEAVGFSGDNFYNLVSGGDTTLSLQALQKKIKEIEADNGRSHGGEKFSARTLDIDILTFDVLVGNFSGIKLPRDEITFNAFVLKPLADIAPETAHPKLKIKYESLWKAFDKREQKLWQVDFDFS